MTSTVLSLALLALLVAAASGMGGLFLRRVRSWSSGPERAVFAVALGMGAIAYVVFLLGLLRLLKPAILLALLIAAVIFAVAVADRNLRRVSVRRAPAAPLAVAGGIAFSLLGLCTLIGALAPPGGNEWDALAYHLAVPKLYLSAERIYYVPWVSHSNFPFTLQMLYTLMLGLGSVGAAKSCHWLCGALLILSVYTFAVRHLAPQPHGKTLGLIAALIVAATPIVLWEASVAYVDLATALFTWLSLYALFNAAQTVNTAEERPYGSVAWLIVSALLMGLALGTKYTVLGFWGLLLVGILLRHIAVPGRWSRETLPRAALWALVSLLIAAPWYIKTWLYTGNPVYPFFYHLFGGRYWSAENAALYAADQAAFGMGKSPLDLLLSPWRVTMQGERFTEYAVFGLSPVYVALLLAAPLVLRRLSRPSAALGLFGLGVYLFWFFLMQQTRYLIPALPALAILCAETLVAAWQELRLARWFGAALVAASVLWASYLSATLIAAPALPVVTGRISASEHVERALPGLAPAITFINQATPKDAKVALFSEVRGFYLDRDYLWATPNHATLLPWDRYHDVEDWLTDFRRRGYTTLLVNRRFTPRDAAPPAWLRLLREAVAQNRLTLAFEANGVEVYRIP